MKVHRHHGGGCGLTCSKGELIVFCCLEVIDRPHLPHLWETEDTHTFIQHTTSMRDSSLRHSVALPTELPRQLSWLHIQSNPNHLNSCEFPHNVSLSYMYQLYIHVHIHTRECAQGELTSFLAGLEEEEDDEMAVG